jgi:tripartite-type tricarboxylate transporter receptor subunit TctC
MQKITRRLGLAALTLATLAALNVQAQDYPNKPIKIIAPFPAGTGPDANTREIAQELSKALGQSVVVENRPGASTMIGMEAGAKAAPDGYTLVMGSTTSMSVLPYTYGAKVPYKVDRDFVPISIVGLLNTALTAHPSLPEKNAKELIERLKAQPGSVTAATSGIGSYSHLAGEWFASSAGVKINFIPYNTTSPYADLVAGQVNVIFDALPAAIGNVKAGKLKILALTGKTRHPNFPDVPTFAEAGLADYSPTAWIGLFAPAATPAPIVAKLGEAMQKAASQNPELIAKWRSYGGDLKAQTPSEFSSFLKQDDALWGPAIKKAGVKLD